MSNLGGHAGSISRAVRDRFGLRSPGICPTAPAVCQSTAPPVTSPPTRPREPSSLPRGHSNFPPRPPATRPPGDILGVRDVLASKDVEPVGSVPTGSHLEDTAMKTLSRPRSACWPARWVGIGRPSRRSPAPGGSRPSSTSTAVAITARAAGSSGGWTSTATWTRAPPPVSPRWPGRRHLRPALAPRHPRPSVRRSSYRRDLCPA